MKVIVPLCKPRINLFIDNKGHEDEVFFAGGVVDGVAGAVGRPGRVAGADRALGAVVIVDGFAGENEIALTVTVMLVIAEDRTSGNGHARVKPTLVTELLVEDLLDRDRHRTVSRRHRHRFHKNQSLLAFDCL